MRTLIIIALLHPIIGTAQINRSAREFASERIQEYIGKKLFKDQPYKPVSFGELKTIEERNPEITWVIEHRFAIMETHEVDGKETTTRKVYDFIFYMDKKMKVQRAQTFFVP